MTPVIHKDRLLGHYELVERIHQGSRSSVWKALNPSNRMCALKRVSKEALPDGEALRIFRRAAKLQERLAHPGLLKASGLHEHAQRPYYAMEYFPADSLRRTQAENPGRIHTKEFTILRKIAETLDYLHGRGLVHGDVRAENILIGTNGEVRVIGLGRATTAIDRMLHRSSPGPAPEQILGQRVDFRSDYYAFGLLMYELLTGRPPFQASTPEALARLHCHEWPLPMRTHVPTLAPEMDSFLWRLIAKKREDRFDSINDILAGLYKLEWAATAVRLRQVRRPDCTPLDAAR